MILFYIIEEFSKLLKYNTQKTNKIAVSNLIIDFINESFNSINNEKHFMNIDIKRFNYIISSKNYLEISELSGLSEVEGIYGEYIDKSAEVTDEEEIEARIDNEEESDALDIDYKMDGEDADYPFEQGQDMIDNWMPSE